jgi:signal peptide peptidase SppA
MRYDRLFTKLFCTPLCLEAGVRAGFERVLLAFMSGQPTELPRLAEEQPQFFGRKTDPTRADRYADNLLEIHGKTAIIHIDGAIDRHLSAWDRLCFEATDLNDVNRALSRIENDGAVEHVLLAINSPGGTVNGVPETAGRIGALAERKNVKAFIDGMGCSAAYWLAAAADEVFATGSSMSGSIGVYLALLDESRWLENEGLKIETIKDGKLKAAGASWKPLTEEERAHFQSTVTQIGEMFRAAVTEKRIAVERATMEGQSLFGRAALNAGLVDAIVPDLSTALAQF